MRNLKSGTEKERRYKELSEKSSSGELSDEELTERVNLYYEISGKERVDFSDVEAVDYEV